MTIKEKFETGNFIPVLLYDNGYERKYLIKDDIQLRLNGVNITLVHKKHKDILEAYLLDNNVEIIWNNGTDNRYNTPLALYSKCENFIDTYNEDIDYKVSTIEKDKQEPHRYKAGKEEVKIETIQAPNSELKFIKPTNFKIELLKECHDGIIAYIELDTGYSTGVIYNAYGKIISADDSEYRKQSLMLTPYQEPKKWYEIESNFPCLIRGEYGISVAYYYQEDNGNLFDCYEESIISAKESRVLTNEEIDSLKVNL